MAARTAAALRRLGEVGRPELAQQLDRFFAAVAAQAAVDEGFARTLAAALGGAATLTARDKSRTPGGSRAGLGTAEVRRRGGRRPPGPFNPYEVYAQGE